MNGPSVNSGSFGQVELLGRLDALGEPQGLAPRCRRRREQQDRVAGRGRQIGCEPSRIHLAVGDARRTTGDALGAAAVDDPGSLVVVDEERPVETGHVPRRQRTVAPRHERAGGLVRDQGLDPALSHPGIGAREGREHEEPTVVDVHLGRPELGVRPEVRGWTERRDRALPGLEVVAGEAVEAGARSAPEVRVGRPEQHEAAGGLLEDVWVAHPDVAELQTHQSAFASRW